VTQLLQGLHDELIRLDYAASTPATPNEARM